MSKLKLISASVVLALGLGMSGSAMAAPNCVAAGGILVVNDCTFNSNQTIVGDLEVVGDLTIDATFTVTFSSAASTIDVGGDLTVNGEITTKGANHTNDEGTPGGAGGDLTFEVGGDVVISSTGEIITKGGNGGNGNNNPGTNGALGGAAGDITFLVCGTFTMATDSALNARGGKGGKGGNTGGPSGTGGNGANGGAGGVVDISADSGIDIDGTIDARGGMLGMGGNGNTNGTDGSTGAVGMVFLNTPVSIDIAGSDIQPTAIEDDDADPVCVSNDPFPDGATSHSQGFYGNSKPGEPLVDDIINGALTVTPEELCEEINIILTDVDEELTLDCALALDRELILAFFLTGTIGPGADDGFLPAGNQGGIKNLAAQKITLLLNLELAAILADPAIPMQSTWFLNIDPVQDLVEGAPDAIIDPVLTTEPKLCVDVEPEDGDGECEEVEVLNDLGMLLEDLDERGTTIQEVLDAADAVLADPNHDPVDIGTVTGITADELTKLLGCINEAFDGMITGVVTAFDAD